MNEVLTSPVPRITNMVKARIALDEKKIKSLKESMKEKEGK